MANMDCTNQEKNKSKGGCCDRCPAGMFIEEVCNATNGTKCSPCPPGKFTDQQNSLKNCIRCKTCVKNWVKVSDCTAEKDTVCECKPNFYCRDGKCEDCEPWTPCREGEGVKQKPTPISNTVCAPCENGTYSNTTDYTSRCKPHSRCKDLGLPEKTPGTSTTDAVCGTCESRGNWMLPAGLWAGLVLTIVVVAAFIYFRAKRRSYRAGRSKVSVTTVMVVPEPVFAPPELPPNYQESCTDCKSPSSTSDDPPIIHCIGDSMDSSHPITPLKASISFAEPSNANGNASNFFRSYSEPQEDEWWGT